MKDKIEDWKLSRLNFSSLGIPLLLGSVFLTHWSLLLDIDIFAIYCHLSQIKPFMASQTGIYLSWQCNKFQLTGRKAQTTHKKKNYADLLQRGKILSKSTNFLSLVKWLKVSSMSIYLLFFLVLWWCLWYLSGSKSRHNVYPAVTKSVEFTFSHQTSFLNWFHIIAQVINCTLSTSPQTPLISS